MTHINNKPLRERIADILRDLIIKGDLKPGDAIVETELASKLGVSRAPLREALQTLNTEGLVEIIPYYKTIVRHLKQRDITELYSLRSTLETFATRLIIEHNNPSDINCVVSYNSYGKGSRSKVDEYANAICVNPVSWKNDDQYVHANDHLGGVGKDFKNIDEKLLSCQCQNGVLWIENLRKKNYPVLGNKNYHLSEYLLFYASIRENIKNRVSSFLER